DTGVTELAEIAEHRNFDDGARIIQQGEAGDGFYLVVEGQVRVTLAERDDAQVARIGPGGFFGEMAMLSEQGRSASVWSVGRSTLLFFDKIQVLPLLERYPRVREVLSGVALKRTEDNLWSVLFDEREVDETLAELEASVGSPLPATDDAVPQAPTTARLVERGETLPQNDYSSPSAPPASEVDAPAFADEQTAMMSVPELEALGAESPPSEAPPDADPWAQEPDPEPEPVIVPGDALASPFEEFGTEATTEMSSDELHRVAEQVEQDERERRRRHEDETVQLPALGAEGSEPEVQHGDTLRARQRQHDSPTVQVAAYRPEDEGLERPGDEPRDTAIVARARKKSNVPIFVGGAGLGFAIGLAAALAALRFSSLVPDAVQPSEPVATEQASEAKAEQTPVADPEEEEIVPPEVVAATEAVVPDEAEEQEASEQLEEPVAAEGKKRRPIPSFSVTDRELTSDQESQRKSYRKRMFAAFDRQAWIVAIRLGFKLRNDYRLDWEAELKLADAQRLSGEKASAIATYRHFVSNYPTNLYADTARFWLGELFLERGDTEKAKRLFVRVAENKSSDFGKSAKRRLEEMN
ncbi:MAG: cyclic nucleotide-binding domain-containing protein, partial [Myxococcota bacterium]